MPEKRFVSQSCSVEKFILDQENESTGQKTRRDELKASSERKARSVKLNKSQQLSLTSTFPNLLCQFARKTARNRSQRCFQV